MGIKVIKKRADELLAANLGRSRNQAQAMIMAGEVMVGDKMVRKAGEMWPEDTAFEVKPRRRFVSRGGFKMEGALADLSINPEGLTVLDVGASTGGFTDCLLQSGAAKVTAVDVGTGLIDARLRQDSRVTVVEKVNARRLAAEMPGKLFDLVVIDVSFISLELILPAVVDLLLDDGQILAMVKPQFEVGREKVGKKGVVRDPLAIAWAVDKISALGPKLSPPFQEVGRAPSRLLGPEGNQEVFLLLSRGIMGIFPKPLLLLDDDAAVADDDEAPPHPDARAFC